MFPLSGRFDMRRRFSVKKLNDGRAMVNLGCGTRMNKEWNNLDFSPYARLVRHKAIAEAMKWVHLLSEERYNTLLDVDQELTGAAKQPPLARLLEGLVRGNASESGESPRWMYDEYSLRSLMSDNGFRDIRKVDSSSSRIDGWNHFGLDTNGDGSVYKNGSLYMEAAK